MGFIKEFKQFAIQGNLVDIAIAFVMGGAFGKVVSAFTEKMVAPAIGLLTNGQDLKDKKFILKQAVEEVRDPLGNIVVKAGTEVNLEWGFFVTTVIDFTIVAFVMFLIIKAINKLKKKEIPAPAAISTTDQLLTEIRDSLKK